MVDERAQSCLFLCSTVVVKPVVFAFSWSYSKVDMGCVT